MKQITITARNGYFKALISELINNEKMKKFDMRFIASMEEMTIVFKPKKGDELKPAEWKEIIHFLSSSECLP